MASAAAVAADASRPSLPDNLSDDEEITGAITSLDDPAPSLNGVIQQTTEARDDDEVNDDEDEDDLFGDGDMDDGEPAIESPKQRKLDDEDLDSGDDLDRDDRGGREGSALSQQEVEQSQTFVDVSLLRHSIPEPSDNEMYLLKVPRFLDFEQTSFHHKSFQPPTSEHHSTDPPSNNFSAYNTAMTTLRWRHCPSNPKELQSNARILRWSDGSLTLQLASDSMNQYEIEANALAPPQRNPPKPTPTSIKGMKSRHASGPAYNAAQDTFTYLAATAGYAGLIRTTNKITTGLTIQPSANTVDEAMEKLEKNIALHNRGGINSKNGISVVDIAEDPELEKRKAEAAEREKVKMQRTREKQELRERERANRSFGRAGPRTGMGLSVGGLEGEGRSSFKGAGRAKPRRQRRDDYSEDEDFGKRHSREDEYDEEDDFIAGSDEEEEIVDDDDDIDDGIEKSPRHGGRDRENTPKRPRASDAGGDDDDDGGVVSTSRVKRRRVVEEDDDDE